MKTFMQHASFVGAVVLLLFVVEGWTTIRSSSQSIPPPPAINCVPPLEPNLRIDLYMDRSIDRSTRNPDGTLPTVEWEKFVAEVLAKQLPGGTINTNSGWWRRPDGTVFNGLGRTLTLLAPAKDAQAHRAAVQNVISEYKKRTGSRSVGWEEDWVCVAW